MSRKRAKGWLTLIEREAELDRNAACGFAFDLGREEATRARESMLVAMDRWLELGKCLADVSDKALKAEAKRRGMAVVTMGVSGRLTGLTIHEGSRDVTLEGFNFRDEAGDPPMFNLTATELARDHSDQVMRIARDREMDNYAAQMRASYEAQMIYGSPHQALRQAWVPPLSISGGPCGHFNVELQPPRWRPEAVAAEYVCVDCSTVLPGRPVWWRVGPTDHGINGTGAELLQEIGDAVNRGAVRCPVMGAFRGGQCQLMPGHEGDHAFEVTR